MNNFEPSDGKKAALTRGVSKVAQSNLQIDISRGFPSAVLPTLKPISTQECAGTVINQEVLAVQAKTDQNWFIPISDQKTVHIMEHLLPLNWNKLKTVATYTKVLPKRIRGLDNSQSLSHSLVKMVNDYLLGELKASPHDFLEAYKNWIQTQVDNCSSKMETLDLFGEDLTQAQFKKDLYRAFGQLHTVSIGMHKLCEVANLPNSKLRERSSYLMQVYRYKDALLHSGVKFFIEKFVADTQEYIQSKNPQIDRPFRNALYTDPNSSMARLVTIAIDRSGIDYSDAITCADPKVLKQIDPKLARLIRYGEKIYKEEQPRIDSN